MTTAGGRGSLVRRHFFGSRREEEAEKTRMGEKAAEGNWKLDMVRDGESGSFDKLQSYMWRRSMAEYSKHWW